MKIMRGVTEGDTGEVKERTHRPQREVRDEEEGEGVKVLSGGCSGDGFPQGQAAKGGRAWCAREQRTKSWQHWVVLCVRGVGGWQEAT